MLKKLLDRVSATLADTDDGAGKRDQAVSLATAALLVEVARADHDFDGSEFDLLLDLIERHFELSPDDAAALSDRAEQRVEDSVSLHEFTSVLHRELGVSDKTAVVAMLWTVAYADGRLDMYEDALVLKIADLLYVPRSDVMRLKAEAAPE